MTRSLAVYGKGGSGKSTIAAALSSCLAGSGKTVLHIGCDPKADSSRLLVPDQKIITVMGTAHDTDLMDASSILMPGIKGITCVEAGGPEPGVGCGGRAITRAFELLEELDVSFQSYDMVIYDVLGDVVCGGFALPLRSGHAELVALVVSGTERSLFAANNIMKAVCRFHRNGVRLAGLVGNYHTGEMYRQRVASFARETGTQVLADVPYDAEVQRAEELRKTVYDLCPGSETARTIDDLARRVLEVDDPPTPRPLEPEQFETFLEQNPAPRRE